MKFDATFFAYVFSGLNYLVYCISRFSKGKIGLLVLDVVSKICTIISVLLLGSLTGAYSFFLWIAWLIVLYVREKSSKKWSFIKNVTLYTLFLAAYVTLTIFTFAGLSSILVMTCCVAMMSATWWLPPQGIRIVGAVVTVPYLFYQIAIKNWVGLLEIFVLLANIISFIKYKKSKKSL